jgi:agmatine/peptidylarginine deiminase
MNMPRESAARRLPAEWEPQDAVMLTWPHDDSDWAPTLHEVEPVFVAIAVAVCAREQLLLVVRDAAHLAHVESLLEAAGVDMACVRAVIAPSNDTSARDHGPITVHDAGTPRLLDFVFNGWGGKFEASLDDAITARLQEAGVFGAATRERIAFVLEGGSLESDGAGTLITTHECQHHAGRNPALDTAAIEAQLRTAFGLQRVLWLHHGQLEGDDTDGHIDTLVRLCDTRTLAYQHCDDAADPHFAELSAMEAEVKALRTTAGEPYQLVPLPWPSAKRHADGRRMPATYANFLILNGAVLVPTYRDANDAIALERLRGAIPGREVIGIDCLPLIAQGGSLHCVTMQLPAGTLAP